IVVVANDDKPNIVLIMADDIGIEGISCYGSLSYQTPNIDQLAKTGLRFTNAHAQPLCANTRLQLMTGFHNNRNWIAFGILDPKSKTIGHYLSEAGYKSCIAGKWQLQSYDPPDYPGSETRRGLGMHPKDAGFDNYSLFHSLHTEDKGSRYADPTWLEDGKLKNEPGEYGPDMWVDYINRFMEQEKDNPSFVYYPMALPHWPMTVTPDSEGWKDSSSRLVADTENFKDMVEYMDKCIGKIVTKIDELGLRDNTLIIFYSDNGTHLKITTQTKTGPVAGGKAMPTDAGTHVPLIANWPEKVRVGVSEALIDSTDFIPTLMEATHKPLPKDHKLDGISFYQKLAGDDSSGPTREWIYSFYDPRPGWDKDRFRLHVSARDRRWKLYETGNLFDITNDILEQKPILKQDDTPETAEIRKRLANVLKSQAVSKVSN
ncbi:MAG: sulfatase-like hydrolase/transferase, partial [Pirellulales bacterium]|nr:sulfatase-like hydrolase/transferase [Pirellulales bacterium]